MTRLADEWAEDGYGDGSTQGPPDDEPLDDEAAQGGGPHERYVPPRVIDGEWAEQETDSEGNVIVEPPSGDAGSGAVHLVETSSGPMISERTICCGERLRDLPNADRLTEYGDGCTCARVEWNGDDPVDRSGEDEQPGPDVDDVAAGMTAYAEAVQSDSEAHRDHESASYDPARGVICGCGEVIEGPQGPRRSEVELPHGRTDSSAADPILTTMPPLNPRSDYGPADLQVALLETVRRLDNGLAMEAYWIEQRELRQERLDVAAARARLQVKGSAKDVRDAEVRVLCAEEYAAVAESRLNCEVLKSAMHSLRSVLSGVQSTGATVRVLYQAGGGDGAKPQGYRR